MIRIKFDFHESSYGTLEKLATEKGVTAAEIVRRALSLYESCNRRLKEFRVLTIEKSHLEG